MLNYVMIAWGIAVFLALLFEDKAPPPVPDTEMVTTAKACIATDVSCDITALYILPQDLKYCKIYNVASDTVRNLTTMVCPNDHTSTTERVIEREGKRDVEHVYETSVLDRTL